MRAQKHKADFQKKHISQNIPEDQNRSRRVKKSHSKNSSKYGHSHIKPATTNYRFIFQAEEITTSKASEEEEYHNMI